MGRLVAVELRKTIDTRAGLWLLAAVGVLTIAIVVLVATVGVEKDQTLRSYLAVATAPATVLLPVAGVLLVTTEWTQRTSLVTFALVPRRGRVVAAKLAAGVLLSLVAVVAALAVAVVATAFAGAGEDPWSLPLVLLGQTALSVITTTVMGIGFGALLLASAPALVLFFTAPIAVAALGAIPALRGVARWASVGDATSPLTEHVMDAAEWGRAGIALALWMVVPVVVGTWRILRAEIS